MVARRESGPGIVSLWLDAPRLATRIQPGQFVNARAGAGPDPLLRRPISVADVTGERLLLVFRVAGRGTALLAQARRGDRLDLLGPLGRPAPRFRDRDVIVCGGGIGIPPLLHFARRNRDANRLQVLLGARRAAELVLLSEFRKLGVPVAVATDDGSRGRKGPVTTLAEQAARAARSPVVVACGPRAMLADLVRRLDPIPVWGFIEERMGCGTGLCACCALPRREGGYVRFCQDGPVVLLNEVRL